MATSVYPSRRQPSSASARLNSDGTFLVTAGTQDLGTGTYTIMTQIAAETFGVPVARVKFLLGDTRFPKTPVSGVRKRPPAPVQPSTPPPLLSAKR